VKQLKGEHVHKHNKRFSRHRAQQFVSFETYGKVGSRPYESWQW